MTVLGLLCRVSKSSVRFMLTLVASKALRKLNETAPFLGLFVSTKYEVQA